MCGRFTLKATIADLKELIPGLVVASELPPRYNIAPTQQVAVVREPGADRRRELTTLRWGLIPRWAESAAIGAKLLNARAETLATKPAFRDALKQRRCVIPATGFYEWRKDAATGRKMPLLIQLPEGKPFVFAGLWDEWMSPDGAVSSCTIITTSAHPVIATVHDRMPAILAPADLDAWLDPSSRDPARLVALLHAWEGAVTMRAVSPVVNNARNEVPECLEPLVTDR